MILNVSIHYSNVTGIMGHLRRKTKTNVTPIINASVHKGALCNSYCVRFCEINTFLSKDALLHPELKRMIIFMTRSVTRSSRPPPQLTISAFIHMQSSGVYDGTEV